MIPSSPGPITGPGSTTTLLEHTPNTVKIGAASDSSDFFGIGIAIVVVVVIVLLIKFAFPSRS